MPNPSGPPPSPDVMAQQMPPMSQYAGQADQMLGAGQPGQQADPIEFAKSKLDGIANDLMTVAKVLGEVKPELMPIVQKMAQAGSQLTSELESGNAPQNEPPPTGTPAQANGPEGMGLGA